MKKSDARGVLLAGLFLVGALVLLSRTAGSTGSTPTRPVNRPTTPSGGVTFTDVN